MSSQRGMASHDWSQTDANEGLAFCAVCGRAAESAPGDLEAASHSSQPANLEGRASLSSLWKNAWSGWRAQPQPEVHAKDHLMSNTESTGKSFERALRCRSCLVCLHGACMQQLEKHSQLSSCPGPPGGPSGEESPEGNDVSACVDSTDIEMTEVIKPTTNDDDDGEPPMPPDSRSENAVATIQLTVEEDVYTDGTATETAKVEIAESSLADPSIQRPDTVSGTTPAQQPPQVSGWLSEALDAQAWAMRMFGAEFVEGAMEIQRAGISMQEQRRKRSTGGKEVAEAAAGVALKAAADAAVDVESQEHQFSKKEYFWALLMLMQHQREDDFSKCLEVIPSHAELRDLAYAFKFSLIAYGPIDTVNEILAWRSFPFATEYGMCGQNQTALDASPLLQITGVPYNSLIDEQPSADFFSAAHAVFIDDVRNCIVVAVRGSKQMHDWLTNLNMDARPLFDEETIEVEIDGMTEPRRGLAHAGILKGVRYKLFDCPHPMAPMLERILRSTDGRFSGIRSVLICGHSLGAGTAALMTLLLRQRFDESADLQDVDVRGIGFATPGVLSYDIATSEHVSKLFTTMVFKDDVVPRLSSSSLLRLQIHVEGALGAHKHSSTAERTMQLLGRGSTSNLSHFMDSHFLDSFEEDSDMTVPGRVLHVIPRQSILASNALQNDLNVQEDLASSVAGSLAFRLVEPERRTYERIVFKRRMVLDHLIDSYGDGLRDVIAAAHGTEKNTDRPTAGVFARLVDVVRGRGEGAELLALAKTCHGRWLQEDNDHPRAELQESLDLVVDFATRPEGWDSFCNHAYSHMLDIAESQPSKVRTPAIIKGEITSVEESVLRACALARTYRKSVLCTSATDELQGVAEVMHVPDDVIEVHEHLALSLQHVETSAFSRQNFMQDVKILRRYFKELAGSYETSLLSLVSKAADPLRLADLRLEQRLSVVCYGRWASLANVWMVPFEGLVALHRLIQELHNIDTANEPNLRDVADELTSLVHDTRKWLGKRWAELMVARIQDRLVFDSQFPAMRLNTAKRRFIKEGWTHVRYGSELSAAIEADTHLVQSRFSAVPGGFRMTFMILFNDALLFAETRLASTLTEWWANTNHVPDSLYVTWVFDLSQLVATIVGTHGVMLEHEDTSTLCIDSNGRPFADRKTVLLFRTPQERDNWHAKLVDSMVTLSSRLPRTSETTADPALGASTDMLEPVRFSGWLTIKVGPLQLSLMSVRRFYRLRGTTLYQFADDIEGLRPQNYQSLAGYTVDNEEGDPSCSIQASKKIRLISSDNDDLVFYADSPDLAAAWRKVLA